MASSRFTRLAATWVAATSLAVGVAGVAISSQADAASATYVTTANLNVRTGPSTSTKILTTLKKGSSVASRGAVSKGWLPVTWDGKKAYVSADYIKTSSGSTKTTTVNVNFRTKPSLSSSIMTVLKKGTRVTAGAKSGDFTAVSYNGKSGYVYTTYLSGSASTSSGSSSSSSSLSATKTLYVNAANVRVRTQASLSSTIITMLSKPTALKSNGKTSNGFTSIVYKGKDRWMASQYLSSSAPGKTSSNAKKPALDLSRADMWDRIATCESSNRWDINTGNGYYGGLQFDLSTWESVDGQDFATRPDLATREEQITVANRLYAKRGLQPWSCRGAA